MVVFDVVQQLFYYDEVGDDCGNEGYVYIGLVFGGEFVVFGQFQECVGVGGEYGWDVYQEYEFGGGCVVVEFEQYGDEDCCS